MDNQISNFQTTMEKIKCSIKQPKVQPHMTLQSLGKHIKQEIQGKEKQSRIQEALEKYLRRMVCITPLASHSYCSKKT
jgi:hypothetical protein